ncbi:hypothetical protein [Methyloprofundus sp.]|uniref:hypothetical protein n=1 Tax=Methyloprofundus sp. TaxID=2020875 RepID=UPI003D0D3A6F
MSDLKKDLLKALKGCDFLKFIEEKSSGGASTQENLINALVALHIEGNLDVIFNFKAR